MQVVSDTQGKNSVLSLFIPPIISSPDLPEFYIPNPAKNTLQQLSQFQFIGQLLGMCLRTGDSLPFYLASFVWKHLVDEPLSNSDFEMVFPSFPSPFLLLSLHFIFPFFLLSSFLLPFSPLLLFILLPHFSPSFSFFLFLLLLLFPSSFLFLVPFFLRPSSSLLAPSFFSVLLPCSFLFPFSCCFFPSSFFLLTSSLPFVSSSYFPVPFVPSQVFLY